jgi:uncharacterized protein YqgV (UPF0045/DUF77 family)
MGEPRAAMPRQLAPARTTLEAEWGRLTPMVRAMAKEVVP